VPGVCLRLKPPPVNLAWSALRWGWIVDSPASTLSCSLHMSCNYISHGTLKVKVWTLAVAPLTWVGLVTTGALQSQKWQLIGMSQWCRSALCGHPLPALMDKWTHGAASRHTIARISHTRHSSRSGSYYRYSFPVPLRVGGWVGLST